MRAASVAEVVPEHDGLHLVRHRTDHVGEVAGDGDDVDLRGGSDEPVVVREAVVQVRDDEDPHAVILPYPRPAWFTRPEAAVRPPLARPGRPIVREPPGELHCPPRAGGVRHLLPERQGGQEVTRGLDLVGTGRMEAAYLLLPVEVEERMREPRAAMRRGTVRSASPVVGLVRLLLPALPGLDRPSQRADPK